MNAGTEGGDVSLSNDSERSTSCSDIEEWFRTTAR